MPTKLFLIRHGQTDGNAKKQYCGCLDICLSAEGRLQAEKLSRWLQGDAIHKIYASDRKRALESARIIFKGRRITRLADLREINFGIFEGKSHQEITRSHPLLYKRWLSDPYATVVPESESLRDFKKRVWGALKEIVSSNAGKTTAVVCHGGTISIILSGICRSKKFWELIPASASLNVIEYKRNKANITLFNDTSHLVL